MPSSWNFSRCSTSVVVMLSAWGVLGVADVFVRGKAEGRGLDVVGDAVNRVVLGFVHGSSSRRRPHRSNRHEAAATGFGKRWLSPDHLDRADHKRPPLLGQPLGSGGICASSGPIPREDGNAAIGDSHLTAWSC